MPRQRELRWELMDLLFFMLAVGDNGETSEKEVDWAGCSQQPMTWLQHSILLLWFWTCGEMMRGPPSEGHAAPISVASWQEWCSGPAWSIEATHTWQDQLVCPGWHWADCVHHLPWSAAVHWQASSHWLDGNTMKKDFWVAPKMIWETISFHTSGTKIHAHSLLLKCEGMLTSTGDIVE